MNFITSVFDKLCMLTIVEQLSRGSNISLDEQNVEDTDPCCLLCRHLPGSQMLQVQCKEGYNLNLDIPSNLHYILLNIFHLKGTHGSHACNATELAEDVCDPATCEVKIVNGAAHSMGCGKEGDIIIIYLM